MNTVLSDMARSLIRLVRGTMPKPAAPASPAVRFRTLLFVSPVEERLQKDG